MNNKGKSLEIALNLVGSDKPTLDKCVESAFQMAQWKDEQYKEQLSSLKDEIQSNLCASSGFNDEYSRGYQDCGMKIMEMIDKILEV